MPNLGTPELLIILLVVLLLVGGKKLPELAKSVSVSLQELRKGVSGDAGKNAKTETAKSE